MNTEDRILGALAELREGQRVQAELAREAIEMAARHEAQRRTEFESLRNDASNWRSEAREMNRSALRRYRMLVRVYGVMMLLMGALLLMLWTKILS